MLRVTGTVTRFSETPYDFDGRQGVTREASILVEGDSDVAKVRIPDHLPAPTRGESIDWAVTVNSSGKVRFSGLTWAAYTGTPAPRSDVQAVRKTA